MKLRTSPIAIDLFCGAGGMSLGFEQAGFNVVAAVDADPVHAATHSINFPHCKTLHKDLTKVTGKELREVAKLGKRQVDVLFGGPPCQGFSSIGHRRQDDERNRLLNHFARIANELKPKYLVVENVAGLLFQNNSKILKNFLAQIKRAGYHYVEDIQVLNANDFGVPQNRRRVIILAALKSLPLPNYPTRTSSAKWTVWDAIRDLPRIDNYQYLLENDVYRGRIYKPTEYSRMLSKQFKAADISRKRGLSGCMRTIHTPETIKRFAKTKPGVKETISRFLRLDKDGLAPTLRAGTGASNGSYTAPRPIHPIHPRCITVREGARLHSFPDWFQFHPTKWHGFRQVGNSVPPLMAKAVATSLLKTILNK